MDEATKRNNAAMEEFFNSFVPGHVSDGALCTRVETDDAGKVKSIEVVYPAPPGSGRKPS